MTPHDYVYKMVTFSVEEWPRGPLLLGGGVKYFPYTSNIVAHFTTDVWISTKDIKTIQNKNTANIQIMTTKRRTEGLTQYIVFSKDSQMPASMLLLTMMRRKVSKETVMKPQFISRLSCIYVREEISLTS